MQQTIIENLGLFLATFATGFVGWFFGRKKLKTETEGAQIENAEKLLDYYKNLVDDLGGRLNRAIENLQKLEIEKQEAIAKFTEATKTIHDLERKVENLTDELKKYKQLSGKNL